MDQAERMDRMYRYQRFIYDLTREYYLLGRDRLLTALPAAAGDGILEIGCGTGRNLLRLARRQPHARLYGLDASAAMLATAAARLRRRGVPNLHLQVGLAEDLDHRRTFGRPTPFDTIYFSYCLSMIPAWRPALDTALANLRPGGSLHIVDFWDQRDLPGLCGRVLRWWLRRFGVRHDPTLIEHLYRLNHHGRAQVQIHPVAGRYAYLAAIDRYAPLATTPPAARPVRPLRLAGMA